MLSVINFSKISFFEAISFLSRRRSFSKSAIKLSVEYKHTDGLVDKVLKSEKFNLWMRAYEEVVGLSDVRHAQDKVINAEEKFLNAQHERRLTQQELQELQHNLRSIHAELDKTHRGDERYLNLLTDEHKILRKETNLSRHLEDIEQTERSSFAALSSAVRESHEKERQRTERTKYWSVIGSVTGVVLGILGSSFNNYMRMKEMRSIVTDQARDNDDLKIVIREISSTVLNEREEFDKFVEEFKNRTNVERTDTVGHHQGVTLEKSTHETLAQLLVNNRQLENDLAQVKEALAVYSDKERLPTGFLGFDQAMHKSEASLKSNMNSSAMWTVSMVYVAFALSVPFIVFFSRP